MQGIFFAILLVMTQKTNSNLLFSTRRIEALTDGVFAIAMTILVLDLKVSDLGSATTNGQLWGALQEMQVNIVSFVVSFLLLGSMWAVHARQFEFITKADRHLVMLNTFRLLVVVCIPFTTSLSAEYPELLLGRIMFPLNFLILTVVSFWEWDYATRKAKGLHDVSRISETSEGRRRGTGIIVTAAVVTILSVFIGTWAFLLFALVPLAVVFVRFARK